MQSILCGDLFDVLPTLEAESFHACVTDPPYGIGFMGREWDTFKPGEETKRIVPNKGSDNPNVKGRQRSPASSPSAVEYDRGLEGQRKFQSWTERWAREVYRVLKPGAYLVVCGAPRSHHRMMSGLEDAGFVVRDCLLFWGFGQGFPKSLNLGDGKGTALKPAYEPIALVWKPFKGTITDCHAQYGTAALNIDACRIGTAPSDDYGRSPAASDGTIHKSGEGWGFKARPEAEREVSDLGRWPANVALNEEAAAMLDEQSGELASGANPKRRSADKHRDVYHGWKGEQTCLPARGFDAGGASRFFYVAKPSREERDLGCDKHNIHPTVKPLALIRWLVRLVTPTGGRVLDPFAGSGTTGMACAAEGFDFTLIEREAEYIPIIEARVRAIAPLFQNT